MKKAFQEQLLQILHTIVINNTIRSRIIIRNNPEKIYEKSLWCIFKLSLLFVRYALIFSLTILFFIDMACISDLIYLLILMYYNCHGHFAWHNDSLVQQYYPINNQSLLMKELIKYSYDVPMHIHNFCDHTIIHLLDYFLFHMNNDGNTWAWDALGNVVDLFINLSWPFINHAQSIFMFKNTTNCIV